MADLTPAEELRAAAARLREPAGDDLLVGLLDAREPLAALLEDAARTASHHQQVPGYVGLPDYRLCGDCQDEECDGLRATDKALAAARVILGGGRD